MNSAGLSDSDLAPVLDGAADDEHRLRLVDAGDEHLLARQDPVAAVAAGGGGDAVRVRPGVGFGDGERHGDRAVGDAGQPALLLLLGAELGDDRAVDRGGDDHHQQRRSPPAAISSITSDSSYMPAPPPPYSSGRLTPMKPSLPASFHNSSVCCAGAGLLQVVVLRRSWRPSRRRPCAAPAAPRSRRSRCRHCGSPCSVSTRASTAPTSTCWPARR